MIVPNKQDPIDMLPPQISNMISSMQNKQTDIFIRDNYCSTLELIIATCQAEVFKFQKERTKINLDVRGSKKRKL